MNCLILIVRFIEEKNCKYFKRNNFLLSVLMSLRKLGSAKFNLYEPNTISLDGVFSIWMLQLQVSIYLRFSMSNKIT